MIKMAIIICTVAAPGICQTIDGGPSFENRGACRLQAMLARYDPEIIGLVPPGLSLRLACLEETRL